MVESDLGKNQNGDKEDSSQTADANRVSKDIVGQIGKAELFVSQIPRSTALPKGQLEIADENPPKKLESKLVEPSSKEMRQKKLHEKLRAQKEKEEAEKKKQARATIELLDGFAAVAQKREKKDYLTVKKEMKEKIEEKKGGVTTSSSIGRGFRSTALPKGPLTTTNKNDQVQQSTPSQNTNQTTQLPKGPLLSSQDRSQSPSRIPRVTSPSAKSAAGGAKQGGMFFSSAQQLFGGTNKFGNPPKAQQTTAGMRTRSGIGRGAIMAAEVKSSDTAHSNNQGSNEKVKNVEASKKDIKIDIEKPDEHFKISPIKDKEKVLSNQQQDTVQNDQLSNEEHIAQDSQIDEVQEQVDNDDKFNKLMFPDPQEEPLVEEISQHEASSYLSNSRLNHESSLNSRASILEVRNIAGYKSQIDILELCMKIRRRPNANLIDEIKQELKLIENSVEQGDPFPANLTYSFNENEVLKYNPDLLKDWDLEMQQLDPSIKRDLDFDMGLKRDQNSHSSLIKQNSLSQGIIEFDMSSPKDLNKSGKDSKKLTSLHMNDDVTQKLRGMLDDLKAEDGENLEANLVMNSTSGDLEKEVRRQTKDLGADILDDSSDEEPIYSPSPDKHQKSPSTFIDSRSDFIGEDSESKDLQKGANATATLGESHFALQRLTNGDPQAKLFEDSSKLKQQRWMDGSLDVVGENENEDDLFSQIDGIEHRHNDTDSSFVRKRGLPQNSKDIMGQLSGLGTTNQRSQSEFFKDPTKRSNRDSKAVTFQIEKSTDELLQGDSASSSNQNRRQGIMSQSLVQAVNNGMQSSIMNESGGGDVTSERSNNSKLGAGFSRRKSHRVTPGENPLNDTFDGDSSQYSIFDGNSRQSSRVNSRENSEERLSGDLGDENDKLQNLDQLKVNDNLLGQQRDRVNQDWERHLNEAREQREREARLSESPIKSSHESPKKLEKVNQEEMRQLVTYKNKGLDQPPSLMQGTFKDQVSEPVFAPPGSTQAATMEEKGFLQISTLLPIIIADSNPHKKKSLHIYLVEDMELSRSMVSQKILYEQLAKVNDRKGQAAVLLKLAKTYFCLNQLQKATEAISKTVQEEQTVSEEKVASQEAYFWKGLIYYYFLHTKRSIQGGRQIPASKQADTKRDLCQMINSCENALLRVRDKNLKIPALFVLLKFTLFVHTERFGCQLTFVSQMEPSKLASTIQKDDYYFGQLAFVELYLDQQPIRHSRALDSLKKLIGEFPKRGEAYIKLWQVHMASGKEREKGASQMQLETQRATTLEQSVITKSSSQQQAHNQQQQMRSESEYSAQNSRTASISTRVSSTLSSAKKSFEQATETANNLIRASVEFSSTFQKRMLLLILSVKSLQKSGQYIQAFELLQREFSENPAQSSLMYIYGKYVVKAMASEVAHQILLMAEGTIDRKKKKRRDFRIDQGYLGSGIGALEECLRSCFEERHSKVNYYIGFAYKVLRMPLKTQEYWKRASQLNGQYRNLSVHHTRQVNLFLQEQTFFTMIAEKADEMIKEKQGVVPKQQQLLQKTTSSSQRKLSEQDKINMIKEYMQSMGQIERLDRPNALLLKARMDAYLIESVLQVGRSTATNPLEFGRRFEELIKEFPSFIDGYIHYWKYLKFRIQEMTGRQGAKEKVKHAEQIIDKSGKKLLDKMREIATNALIQSDCTEVPTGLWVEARIIYAKQMIFEKDVGAAVNILKDITCIIPPYQIEGLSYVQEVEDGSSLILKQTLSGGSDSKNNPLSRDSQQKHGSSEKGLTTEEEMEMFMREADLAKKQRGTSPNRSGKIMGGQASQLKKKTYTKKMFEQSSPNGGLNNGARNTEQMPKGRLNQDLMGQIEKYEKEKLRIGATEGQKDKFRLGVVQEDSAEFIAQSEPVTKNDFQIAKDIMKQEQSVIMETNEESQDDSSSLLQIQRKSTQGSTKREENDQTQESPPMPIEDNDFDPNTLQSPIKGYNANEASNHKNQIDSAFKMLDKIKDLSSNNSDHIRMSMHRGSTYAGRSTMTAGQTGGASGNNRMSMYRKQQTQHRQSSNKRSLTIYNPFAFNQPSSKQQVQSFQNNHDNPSPSKHSQQTTPEVEEVSPTKTTSPSTHQNDNHPSDELPQVIQESEEEFKRATSYQKARKRMSQSVDFSSIQFNQQSKLAAGNSTTTEQQKYELMYEAMKKAQKVWEENNEQMQQIAEADMDSDDDEFDDLVDQKEAIVESENFAVYSKFRFLLLIGKYCANSRQLADEGLKALNDYLLLLDHTRNAYTKEEFAKERALTIYYIGTIFYNIKDYYHSVDHLYPILEDLFKAKYTKELALAERKVSKIWRLNFNPKTIQWDYFSIKNMDNFKKNEESRQANKLVKKMKKM